MKSLSICLSLLVPALQAAPEKFTDRAWREIAPIYREIERHPFNQELAKGTLPRSKFDFYSTQDSAYLTGFYKALSVLQRDVSSDAMKVISGAVAEEKKALPSPAPSVEIAPFNFHYINYLLATAAYASREELAAALLPCFWIYLEVGRGMQGRSPRDNPYRDWVELYASTRYEKSVEAMKEVTNRLAENASAELREKMLRAFVQASRMEWSFWDGAYRGETWKP